LLQRPSARGTRNDQATHEALTVDCLVQPTI
jgi:hypothetical protein